MTLPTRDQVQEILITKVGMGKAAMIDAVRNMKAQFPDMDEAITERIVEDLSSYAEFMQEGQS